MIPLQASTVFDSPLAELAFLLGRLLFGLVLAFNGLNHFMDAESMVGYVDSKGVPAPGVLVPLTGAQLLLGGLGIALGIFPLLSAIALATFLLFVTPIMHNFWAVPEDQKQSEMTNFLKNTAMLGGSLVLLALSTTPWPYAVNIRLF